MRLLGKVALGGGFVSAATAGALVAAGVFTTSATLVIADPGAPKAHASEDSLTSFESCDTLLDWYVDRSIREVGPYGWDYGYGFGSRNVYLRSALASGPWFDQTTALKGLSLSYGELDTVANVAQSTGTNTQEVDVDEPDVAKTQGNLVARIENERKLVLLDVSGKEARVTDKLFLPRNGSGAELLLDGDHVLVTQSFEPRVAKSDSIDRYGWGGPGTHTRVLDVDISNPENLRLVSKTAYKGSQISLRRYDDTVRLVTSTGRPNLHWVYPQKKKHISVKDATKRNRALVRATTIEDWVPTATTNGVRKQLVDCTEALHPKTASGSGTTIAVSTFTMSNPKQRSAVAITADGQTVYSSADRLYVTSSEYRGDLKINDDVGRRIGGIPVAPVRTQVHSFALDGTTTRYVASGHVNGTVRDRWSLDEYDGNLRVVWSKTGPKGIVNRSGITVLTERDGRLTPIGRIGGLGMHEDLQAVRWYDGLAILVTYRQIDPLYTVDLSDPENPVARGALKVPGYSGYLHPLGDDLLLGLGVDVPADGSEQGSQAAVFDISRITKPAQVSSNKYGVSTYLAALDDPRAFTWVPDRRTALAMLYDWTNSRGRLLAMHVSKDGELSTRTLTRVNTQYQLRTLLLPDGRIAVVDNQRVRLLSLS